MSASYEEMQAALEKRRQQDQAPLQPEIKLEQLQQAGQQRREQLQQEEPDWVPIPETQKHSIMDRISGRVMGTDVSDPLELERVMSTMVGGVAGGVLGARTPVAPGIAGAFINPVTGSALGSAAGSALGAAAPEATVRAIELAGLVPQGTAQETTLSMEELETVVVGEILLDLSLTGTISTIRQTGRMAVAGITKLTPEARRIADASAEIGIDLMPVQAGRGRLGRGFVAVMGKFPLVGAPIRKRAEAADKVFREILATAPERTAGGTKHAIAELLSRSDLGETIFREARETIGTAGRELSKRYDALFEAADAAHVRILPRHSVTAGEEMLARLKSDAPRRFTSDATKGLSKGELQGVEKIVGDFIETELLPLAGRIDGSKALATQSLRQMDTLMGRLDQQLAALEPSQKRYAQSLFLKLRQAMDMDVLTNARGEGAQQITTQLRELDQEFGQFMQQLVKSTVARKLGSARRRGLRAIELDDATSIPVDKLADMLLRSNSPQMMRELRQLIPPETFSRLAATALNDSIEGALKELPLLEGVRFSVDAFEKGLGISRTGSLRGSFMRELLKDAGEFTPKDLDNLLVAARGLSGAEIPNASQFVARRAVLGGVSGLAGAFVIGHATGGNMQSGLVGALAFLGGSRLIARALADPMTARSFKTVLRPEAERTVKRKAAFQILRAASEWAGEEPDEHPRLAGGRGVVRQRPDEDQLFRLGRQFLLGAERAELGLPPDPAAVDNTEMRRTTIQGHGIK